MRIRSIKPEFWKSERVASLPRDSRLLFIGLWNLADDAGRFRAHPNLIQGELFPYEPELDVAGWMQPLVDAGLVQLYEVDGRRYGLVTGFGEHQKIDKRTESRLPPPPARRTPKPPRPPEDPAGGAPVTPPSPPTPPDRSAGSANSSAGSPERSEADQGSGRGSGKGEEQAPDARAREPEGPGSPEPQKQSGARTRSAPSDAVIALQVALRESPYRSETTPAGTRSKLLLARAIELDAAGMNVAQLAELVAIDAAKAKGPPGSLLAVWLDRRQWRDVLAEQRMKAMQASSATARAKADQNLLDGIYGADPKPAATVVAEVLKQARPA